MRRVVAPLSGLLIAGTLIAGCGSAGTGSACRNLSADLKGIASIDERNVHRTAHGITIELSPSERQARADLQRKAREAIAACRGGGGFTTPSPAPVR